MVFVFVIAIVQPKAVLSLSYTLCLFTFAHEKRISRWAFALVLKHGLLLVFRKKIMQYGYYLNIMIKFAPSEGRNPWIKNAFLAFTHTVKSPVSNKRGGNNATLILFVYSTSTAHAVPHKVYTTAWGICFSVHSLNGVWRYQLYDELDKSLRFSCMVKSSTIY